MVVVFLETFLATNPIEADFVKENITIEAFPVSLTT